jgi:hypothetical protein
MTIVYRGTSQPSRASDRWSAVASEVAAISWTARGSASPCTVTSVKAGWRSGSLCRLAMVTVAGAPVSSWTRRAICAAWTE